MAGWFARTRPPRSHGQPASTQSAFRLGAGIMAPVCQNTSKHNPGHEILFGRPVTPRDASLFFFPSCSFRSCRQEIRGGGGRRKANEPRVLLSTRCARDWLLPSHWTNITLLRIWKADDRFLSSFSAATNTFWWKIQSVKLGVHFRVFYDSCFIQLIAVPWIAVLSNCVFISE